MKTIDARSPRLWASVVLAAILAAGFQPFVIEALGLDSESTARHFDELQYRKNPGLVELCESVTPIVPAGASVAYWAPYPKWWEGYSYSYMRAAYLLGGRQLIPLVDESDRQHPEVLTRVDWVLAWGGSPSLVGFEVVHETDDGNLYRRVK